MRKFFLVLLMFAAGWIACTDGPVVEEEDKNPTPKPVTELTIDASKKYQKISGFGGANRMWGTQFLKPVDAVKAFGTDGDGLGLSLFRVRIPANRDEWPLIVEACQEAMKYGVKIFASPWSPPAALKSNKSDIGGHLLSENYGAFKNHINDYIAFMKERQIDIEAISIQNEPDIKVSYESCDWTVEQMADFISVYGDSIIGSKLAAPESFNFNENFVNTLLLIPAVEKNIDIIAGHIYGNGQRPFPLAIDKGKEIWMTEYLLNLNVGNTGASWANLGEGAKWDESLEMLTTVHTAMVNNWNAYIWWYLQRFYSFLGDGEQGTASGAVLKRGVAFSHFSRYVRPGAQRIEISSAQTTSIKMTAYEDAQSVVVVLINATDAAITNIELGGFSKSKAVAYTTGVNDDRLSKTLSVADGKIAFDLPRKSVTTIVLQN